MRSSVFATLARSLRLAWLPVLLCPALAGAYPGQLDASYGTNGVTFTQPSFTGVLGSNGGASGMVRLADGKLVVAGSTNAVLADSRFALVRYMPDGSIDSGFGIEGRVNGGPAGAQASGVLKDASDRYLVFGQAYDAGSGRTRFALARFLPDGSLDTGFGTGGTVTTVFDDFSSTEAHAARLDSQGRIVVAGSRKAALGTVSHFALARYLTSGVLDATFGQGGTLVFGVGTNSFDIARGIALDAAGRLVVVGSAGVSGMAVVRLLANGAFDPTFGGTGKVLPGLAALGGGAVEIDAFGGILVAGEVAGGPSDEVASGPSDVALFRLTGTGSLDAGFGAGGVAVAGVAPHAFSRALFVDAAGRIVVSGGMGQPPKAFVFARFLGNGTLDPMFGSGGRQTIALASAADAAPLDANAVVPGDAGRILFAGDAGAFAVGGLLEDGGLDPAFNGGAVSVALPAVSDEIAKDSRWQAIALAAGDRAVVAGSGRVTGGDVGIVSRRIASGVADPAFAGTGVLAMQVARAPTRFEAVAVDASDRIVLAGSVGGESDRRFAVARLLPGGSRDLSFGTGGEVVIPFGTSPYVAEARALAIDGSGRLVVGGVITAGNVTRFALARLLPDGAPDPSFGTGGQVLLDTGSSFAGIRAIALDAAGRIVAVGEGRLGSVPVAVRFTSSGVPDASFGLGGVVDLAGPGRLSGARSVAIDGSGRIVVGGPSAGFPLLMAFARLDASGAPDPAFGTGGFVTASFAGTGTGAHAIAIEGSGRILAAGGVGTQLRLVRLNADGSADADFGGTGFTNAATGGSFIEAAALRPLPGGRALVAGATGSAEGAFVARFVTEQAAGTNLLVVNLSGSGVVTSTPGGISCGAQCVADFPSGTAVTLEATAGSNHRFVGWAGACSGTGGCTVSVDATRSVVAIFVPNLVGGAFANLSSRVPVRPGEDALIGGFIVGGVSPATVVVRARGPSLAASGVAGPLPNPRIDLFAGSTPILANDRWADAPNAIEVQLAGLAPSDPNEAAVLADLMPGSYTVVVSGVADPPGTPVAGTGIVEIFSRRPDDRSLINLSTRGRVLTGDDVMIAGFIVQGTQPQSVVIRARGPSLGGFGITGALADPFLRVFAGAVEIAQNDDWASGATNGQVLTLGLEPSNGLESAIYLTLAPGAYTAVVTGKNGATGVAIVEVFSVDTLP